MNKVKRSFRALGDAVDQASRVWLVRLAEGRGPLGRLARRLAARKGLLMAGQYSLKEIARMAGPS